MASAELSQRVIKVNVIGMCKYPDWTVQLRRPISDRSLASYGLPPPPGGNLVDHVFLKTYYLAVFCSMLAIWRWGVTE